MSYSGFQSYGAHYGNSPNDPNAYRAGQPPANNGSVAAGGDDYQRPASHAQYNTSAYKWPGGSQQNYGPVHGEAQSSGNDTWRGMSGHQGQQPAYESETKQSSYGGPTSTAGTRQNFYSAASQTTTQSAQGLNSLAYASGLEAAGLQDASHGVRFGNYDSTTHSALRNTAIPQVRTSSPAQATQTCSDQKPISTHTLHAHQQSNPSQQDLATSAAAALAGVVSRRHGNQQPATLAHYQSSAVTPSMGNAQSTDRYNTQPSYGATSPHDASASNTLRTTQHSAQHNRVPSSQYANSEVRRHANNSSPNPSTVLSTVKLVAHNRTNHQGSTTSHDKPHVPNSTAQNNSSVANLVTNGQGPLLPDPQRHGMSSDAMPSYIDPSEVFNPYHKEYEQKKREAAEAEAEARRKANETPAEKAETWSQVVVPSDLAAPRVSNITPSAPEKPQKITKHKEKKSGPVQTPAASAPAISPSQSTSDADADMAKEMKTMIERMREWKNKDPSMFQKLWDDMKKGGAAPAVPTGTTPTPSPHIRQASLSQDAPSITPPAASSSKTPSARKTQGLDTSSNTPLAASAPKTAAARKVQGVGFPTQLNGYKVVIEANDEGLPDLGRFPAERRYRQPYARKEVLVSSQKDEISPTMSIDPSLLQQPPPGPQSVPQPLPARTPAGTTIWPEEKRKALAEAAVKALNAEPANQDKGITPQRIHEMLEQNPSYIDLCILLENLGLKFHRGQFARQLLSNVPDLASTQNKWAPEAPSPSVRGGDPIQSTPALAQTIPTPHVTSLPQTYMNGSHPASAKVEMTPATAIPSFQSRISTPREYVQQSTSATKPGGTPLSRSSKAWLGVPAPNVPPPVPGSKDALSRKRNFSELVDLTQLSDDEDYVMPSKQPRLEEPSPEPEVFKVDTDVRVHNAVSAGQPPHVRSAFAQSLQFNPHQPQHAVTSVPQPVQRPRSILARPINKSEALRKSYYDPKTVARDILIAAGRHPSDRPLNAHLAGLLHRHIDLDSDLSTFDWDAVDPGGPPMPRVQMVDIPAGPPKWKLGAQRKAPRSTRGDEPITDRPDHHANSSPAFDSLARLSTQTRSILQDSQRAFNAVASKPSHLRRSQLVDDVSQDGVSTTVTPQKRTANSAPTPPPSPSTNRSRPSVSLPEPESAESERNMETMSAKRRGRPPGAKNKHPSVAAMKKAANTSPLVSIPSRPRSLPPAHFDVYDCQWRKCNAKLHNLATLRKHIAKVHPASTEEATKFGHTCWWKKCRTLQRNEDKTVVPKERFRSHSAWMDHIEEEHLHALGMEKGDGPSTTHIGKSPAATAFDVNRYLCCPPPARSNSDPLATTVSYLDPQSIAADRAQYLSDEHGRAVTAPTTKATNNEYAPDALILVPVSNDAEERVPMKQYMRAHGNEKMDLKTSAAETLRAMEVHKERVGPGMDRGGCTLVNAERRGTLLQNQGIARVITDYD